VNQHWRDLHLVVVDTETTGLDASKDRVIEVGIIHFEAGQCVDRYGVLVNPGIPIPQEVVELTGIKDDDVRDAPPFEVVAAEVAERLGRGVIVGYNLAFDRGFLTAELTRCSRAWPEMACLDPLILVRELHRNQGSKKLAAAAARMGINLEEAHRATADAEVAGLLLIALATQFEDRLPRTLEEMLVLQAHWEQQQVAEQAQWRRNRGRVDTGLLGGASAVAAGMTVDEDGLPALGPAFVYGDETDFMRAMFMTLPDIGARRQAS
jgi:DNA polymerase-3 subunit epsilon